MSAEGFKWGLRLPHPTPLNIKPECMKEEMRIVCTKIRRSQFDSEDLNLTHLLTELTKISVYLKHLHL